MDYTRRKSRIKPEISSLQESYPHDLQLYRTPPVGEINLTEFQELMLERLRLLRIVESVYMQSQIEANMRLPTVLSELRNDNNLSYYVKLLQGTGADVHNEADLKARRKDHISHFLLHLAHCSSDELKRWFIGREVELFKLRYSSLNSEGVRQFLKLNDLNYVPISQSEKDAIKDYLSQSTVGCTDAYIEVHDFYKVSFCEVTDLVRNRRIYVRGGFAYIAEKELISVFVTILKMQLASALAHTKRGLPMLSTDDRIYSIMSGLHNAYTGVDYTVCDGASVPIESLDALSKTSYPLCMRLMHETLRLKHHLKHNARQQYGLFLKGIGVLYDDAIRFWREEFSKVMELDKFEKDYLYNIKHNFGKVGKRTNYTPYSCMKIIQSSSSPDSIHGCPFKELDINNLRQRIMSYGLSATAVQTIVGFAEEHHYQIACTKYFEALHKCPPPNAILHPNGYFKDSQNILTDGKPTTATGQTVGNEKSEKKSIKSDTQLADTEDDFVFDDIVM